ncbi:MAG: hypothetical protein H0U71_06735 [Gammaproteobacteria bacterium]|nr:hypothetical protein [Gammaproteobacteria bacterium]
MKNYSNAHITLALPNVSYSDNTLFDAARAHLSVAKTLAKAKHRNVKPGEAMLFNVLTGSMEIPPHAAISALGQGFQGHDGWWLRIDPVEFLVDAGNVCLIGRDHLLLEEHEVQALITDLNAFLEEDQLVIRYGSLHEWYIQLPSQEYLVTRPLYEVMAHDIRAFLPQGTNQKWWHKILTELQMLLFQHAVNAQRQKLGKPLVNGVWPWGEGKIEKTYKLKNYTKFWSENSFVKGMLALSGSSQTVTSAEGFLKATEEEGHHFISLEHNQLPLETLQQTIIQLLEKIHNRQIRSLEICLGNGSIYKWQVSKLRLFNLRK